MGSENSILDDCELDEPTKLAETGWLFSKARRKDGSNLSVFSLHKKDTKDSHAALKKAIKCLRRVRHPFIVSYIASGESYELGSYYVTEELVPLEQCLHELSGLEICAGLYNILQALLFLHEKVGVCHNNICASSVFTDREGNWQLGGLDYTCPFKDASKEFLLRTQSSRCKESVSPEEKKGSIDATAEECKARDIYSLAIFVEELLEKLNQLGDLMKTFELRIQDECLNVNPKQRPDVQSLLNDHLFRNDFLEILCFLKDITLKTDEEKKEFFSSLVPKLRSLPRQLIGKRLCHPLLSRFVLLEPAANKHMIPHLLTPDTGGTYEAGLHPLLDEGMYKRYVILELVKIFHVHDLTIRKILLKYFSRYCQLIDEEILSEIVFPQILLGLRDSDKELVSSSLHALADMVLILGTDVVIGGNSKKYFTEGNPKFGDSSNGLPLKNTDTGRILLKDLARMSVKGARQKRETREENRKQETKRERIITQMEEVDNEKVSDSLSAPCEQEGEFQPGEDRDVKLGHCEQSNNLGGHSTDDENSEYGRESPESSCTSHTNTVLEETPTVNWSDVDSNISPVINSTHSLPNHGKMKLQHSMSSTSEDTVPKLQRETADWNNDWEDDSTSFPQQKLGTETHTAELGLEYDIKNITVKKVSTPELDFFADMTPTIISTEAVSILGVLPEKVSKTGSSLSFAVKESEMESAGWDEEDWNIEDF